MSSPHHSVLGSLTFQRAATVAAVLTLLALVLIWAVAGALVWRIDTAQKADITETVTWLEDLYYGEGPDRLGNEIQDEGRLIWPDDLILDVQNENGTVITWRNQNYDVRAGFAGLYGDEGWDVTTLDHRYITQEMLGFRVGLRGGDTLTVATFVPPERAMILRQASVASIAIVIFAIGLVAVMGTILSRVVFRRITDISDATHAVAKGEMTARAPVTGRHDEFDRLSGDINRMLDRVATLNSNIEAVSIGVAHDLRTPLTNIGGRLELMRRDLEKPDAIGGHVDAAEQHLSQLLRVFDALLRLGEVEAGRRKAAFDTVDLTALVTHMGDSFAPVFADADKVLTVKADPDITMEGDQELLEQALANLLENAVEHTRDAARVTLGLERKGGVIALRVSDDGPGISAADKDHIFDRFFRADSSRGTAGNGLGLSLVKAISELHGGTVNLETTGGGASFSLNFQQAD